MSWGNLAGLRVLDLTIWRPGPYATQLLAEQGADVLKVEPPGGDPMRSMPDLFDILGAHKRSIVLDLKSEAGRDRCLELAAECDVFVESYRPGVADRLGVGYDAVSARNPAVVYCSISGFGATGPLAQVAGHDVNYLAAAGVLTPEGGTPRQPTIPIGDLGGGIAGAFGIVTAVLGARATGKGERVDVALTDVLSSWVGPVGKVRMVGVEKPLAGLPGYGVFPTADGGHVALGIMNEDHFWAGLCRGARPAPRRTAQRRADRPRAASSTPRSPPPSSRSPPAPPSTGCSPTTCRSPPCSIATACSSTRTSASGGWWSSAPTAEPTTGPMVRFEARPGHAPYGAPEVAADEPGGWLPR